MASGEDGALFVFKYGGTDSGDGGQPGGFLAVAPTRDPFSPSDRGSPAHLGVGPGGNTPWLMFVDTDGVRVSTRP